MENHAVYKTMQEARRLLDADKRDVHGKSASQRCIAIRVGDEYYAVPLSAVKEAIVPMEISPVPGAPPEVLGVINLRSSVVTVVNSRAVLGLSGCPEGNLARILVLEEEGDAVGALVDAVEDIVEVDESTLAALGDAREAALGSGHIRATMLVREHIAFLLHPAGLLGASPGRGKGVG